MNSLLQIPGRVRRGISLVELMVGIAVGLLVVAAATTVVTAQLGSTRQLLLETQLDQDLRAAAEVVTRELRRSGASVNAQHEQWFSAGQPQVDTSVEFLPELTKGDASSIILNYRRGPGEDFIGLKLENNAIKTMISDGQVGIWHEMSDPLTVKVTRFSIATGRSGDRERKKNSEPRILPCPYACDAAGSTDCWPRIHSQEFILEIEGESARDPSIKRTLRTSAAGRTAHLNFVSDAGMPQSLNSCPGIPN
jgi:type II secretory pathway component PulJ